MGSPIPTTPGGNSQGGGIGNSAGKMPLNPQQFKTFSPTGRGTDNTQVNIDPVSQPPALKTLVYSPDVRVIIMHGAKQYDVSSDIVRCSLRRAESSAATFFLTLSNRGQRYTPPNGHGYFSRMDRIVVYMKRTNFVQVFSGYLDSVPYKQLYPGTVNFKATCTLKRIMHHWWNPSLPASAGLLDQSAQAGVGGDGQQGNDTGLGSMLRRILVLAGGWDITNIHIQNFPTVFFEFLLKQVSNNQTVNDKAVQKFKQLLLGSDISSGPGASAGNNPNAGVPGPAGSGSLFYVQQIIAACDERGLGPMASDNNLSAGLAQAGAIGQNTSNATQQKAWQQVQQTNLDAQQANRDSDAAIIGVATAAVETGGGVAIFNYSNPAVPGSSAWGDGPPPYTADLDSCGIFQQRNFAEWGTVAQRMNPKQAAGMFFDHLTSMVPNWRNIDPGAAAQQVQRSAFPAKYSAAMKWATAQVKAVRLGTSGPGGVASALPGGSNIVGALGGVTSGAGAPSGGPNLLAGAGSISPMGGGGLNPAKPTPDSEGAVQFMLSKCGNTPYVWGGHGPSGYDCSGLVSAAYASIGIKITPQTNSIRAEVTQIPKSQAGRGDIYEPHSGHVGLLLGPPGTMFVSAATSGVALAQQIRVEPWYPGSSEWYGRICQNGGPDPTSSFNPVSSGAGTGGVAPSALEQQAGALGTGSSGSSEPIARNLFSYMFSPEQFAQDLSKMWPGEKAFIDGQPLIQIVRAVCNASLRQFQSAPNGDFMAYYPDWWGLDGKPAVFRLEDIEMKDVRIDLSDDPLTTHVYVQGDYSMVGQTDQMLGWLDTAGVVTVEDTWLYQRLIQMAPGDPEAASGEEIMRRFGIRPLKQSYAMAGSHELELLLACHVFMEKWAQQYQTSISLTFMPELYPGMRIELANHNLSVYVTEVVHNCDFEAGFSTTATIMAPANPNGKALMSTVSTPTGPSESVQQAFINPVAGVNNNITFQPGGVQ